MANKQIINKIVVFNHPDRSQRFPNAQRMMFASCVVYSWLFLLRAHAKQLHYELPKCIIEEDLFWEVYNKHFDDVKKLRVVIVGSVKYSSDVNRFSNFFLQVMSKNEIFFADFEVSYRNIEREYSLQDTHQMDSTFFYNILETKYLTSSNSFWRTVKSYSSEPQYGVMIIVWNVEDLRQAMITNQIFMKNHRRSLYSIILVSSETSECISWRHKIGHLLYQLWHEYKMLNVIVQTPCSCEQDKIFKFLPFYPTGKDTWGILDVFPMSTDDKNIRRMMNTLGTMHQYPLRVSIFERLPTATRNLSSFMRQNFMYTNLMHSGGFSGVDGAILENFGKFMHFNLTIIGCVALSECYGSVYRNGTITGSLGLVASGQVDLSANARFVKRYNTPDIEFTYITYSDQVCFVVQKASIVPSWRFLYRAFDSSSWLCIFITSKISIMFWLMKKIFSFLILKKKVNFSLRVVVRFIHTPSYPSLRKGQAIFTAVILLCSVIFTGVFQAVMVKLFSIVTRYNDIDTLQNLLDENYKILSSLDIFTDDNTEMTKKLNQKVLKTFDSKALENVATSKARLTTLERKRDAEYLIDSSYTTPEGEPLLHIVKECPASYFMAYIVPLQSPYRGRFDHLISAFREAGLIEYWYNLMVENLVLQSKVQQNRGRKGLLRPFALKDVEFPFILLLVGTLVSAAVFTLEMFVKRRKSTRKKTMLYVS